MPSQSVLHALATACGVETGYRDIRGRKCEASTPALEAVLSALLDESVSAANAEECLTRRQLTARERCLAPVQVLWDGQGSLLLSPPAGCTRLTLSVDLEQGERHREFLDGARLQARDASGRVAHRLPFRLPMGYHRVTLEVEGDVPAGCPIQSGALWSAPKQAYQGDLQRSWGVFVPTYALHSSRSHGVGDLADLGNLASWLGEKGARTLSSLPLLPTFLDRPYDPSPYAPVSRLFWNELYLALERLPELEICPEAQRLLQSEQFRAESAALRASPQVDYRGVLAHKQPVLRKLAESAFAQPARREALERSVRAWPELMPYAQFRARVEQGQPLGDPGAWMPDELPESAAAWQDSACRYHLYVQAQMAEQLARLERDAGEGGVGLYLDLPLGSHAQGYDAFRYRDVLLPNCSAGAPPDALFEGGQNWGFAPLHPWRSTRSEHRYFRACLTHVMRHAAVVRIDHVMSFHRLLCVPRGMQAKDGVYLRQPAEEFLAAVCIESHRQRCHVVGEDLGTVPEEVRSAMHTHGLGRLYVTQYGPSRPDEHIPENCVASFNTHDMPRFAGFLHSRDIEVQQELGLLDADGAALARRARQTWIEERKHSLRDGGLLDARVSDEAVLEAELSALADTPARRVLVDLEDLWLEQKPQNVPGTGTDWPNWRRRAALSVEQLQKDMDVQKRLALLAERVQESSPAKPAPSVATARLSAMDLHLFNEGTHCALWEKMGAHPGEQEGELGCFFAVWAPNANHVCVIGDFNQWNGQSAPLSPREDSGVWEGFVPHALAGMRYKYRITARDGRILDKADPFAQRAEIAPRTASIIHAGSYSWGDADWLAQRASRKTHRDACSIYEVHLGSWRRGEGGRLLGYREIAPLLRDHVLELGFTHVELLPVMEHPFYGSWGYQCTGYFAASSRYGEPEELMFLIDTLHQAGIGVVLDWVPSHFPEDAHGLGNFDGSCIYEHEDPRQGFHPDWKSLIFNSGRNEVKSFLISSAMYWLEVFHADGLRVDGVASMLYLDYSRDEGEWIPNVHGGRENLENISLLKQLNETVYAKHPDIHTTAEESTAWPMVSRPTYLGGLGFGYKWDMGWMHDTLAYFSRDPVHRRFHHDRLTFRSLYAYNENFVLPLSHDEVVHGKGSMLRKMPGDDWQRFANLRALYAYQFAVPGHKLLFMGSELAPWDEWNHELELNWRLREDPLHRGMERLVRDLNHLYRAEPALHEQDFESDGLRWVDTHNADQSVLAFERLACGASVVLLLFNLTPVPRLHYRIGVEQPGYWRELLNTDASVYGGSGMGNLGGTETQAEGSHGRPWSLTVTLPPLSALYLRSPDQD